MGAANVMKKLRDAAGLTQKAAARAIGVSIENIRKWEIGDMPPQKLFPIIASTYKVSVSNIAKSLNTVQATSQQKNGSKPRANTNTLPDFLPQKMRGLKLTALEQKFLGVKCLSKNKRDDMLCSRWTDVTQNPFEYMATRTSLLSKGLILQGEKAEISKSGETVCSLIAKDPNKLFDVNDMSPQIQWDILSSCCTEFVWDVPDSRDIAYPYDPIIIESPQNLELLFNKIKRDSCLAHGGFDIKKPNTLKRQSLGISQNIAIWDRYHAPELTPIGEKLRDWCAKNNIDIR